MSECTHHDNRGWFLNADSQCMLCGIRFDPNTLLNALEAEVERLKAKAALADEIRVKCDAEWWESDAAEDWLARFDALKETT